MGKDSARFIQFPLFLMREMVINKEEAINNILKYGIYRYSSKFNVDLQDALSQVLYYYYRNKDNLTTYLLDKLETHIDSGLIELDEYYNGFSNNTFDPEFEMEQILKIFETELEFKNKVIEFYQMHLSYNSLGIKGNIERCLEIAKEIEKQIPSSEPFPMISKSLLFEFRDKEKSEFELVQFVAYIAVRSILGQKTFVKTNKKHIVSRIFGYASCKCLPDDNNPELTGLMNKYSQRYHLDKVILSLELNWEVITYSNNVRGMYVSLKNKINMEDLALIVETKKQKNRIELLKQEKKQAKEKALQKINYYNNLKK